MVNNRDEMYNERAKVYEERISDLYYEKVGNEKNDIVTHSEGGLSLLEQSEKLWNSSDLSLVSSSELLNFLQTKPDEISTNLATKLKDSDSFPNKVYNENGRFFNKKNIKTYLSDYIMYIIRYFWYQLKNLFFFQTVSSLFVSLFFKKPIKVIKPSFEEIQKRKYKESFTTEMIDWNSNCDKDCTSRILYQSTPVGNIIFYYNKEKSTFEYYCDASVQNTLLNAVAMNYVITYRCRDYFIDISEDEIQETPTLIEKEQKDCTSFVKLKNRRIVLKDVASNRFTRKGKINHFSFLQQIPTAKTQSLKLSYKEWANEFEKRLNGSGSMFE